MSDLENVGTFGSNLGVTTAIYLCISIFFDGYSIAFAFATDHLPPVTIGRSRSFPAVGCVS